MRRHPLVEIDHLVDLSTGQPPAPLDQRFEPVPRRAVGEHERIDIHLANPSILFVLDHLGAIAWTPIRNNGSWGPTQPLSLPYVAPELDLRRVDAARDR